MVQEHTHNETEIRRFLLGEMPEAERGAFEEKFVADGNLFEQIGVVEDELIESYVRESLAPAEKTIFEREFLSTEPRRRRVALTRTLLNQIKKENEIARAKKTEAVSETHPSVWNSIANFFKTPKLALGAAFAVLFLAFGFWVLIIKSTKNEIEVARQITPTPTRETTESVTNQNSTINQNSSPDPNTNTTKNFPDKSNSSNANRALTTSNQNANQPKENSVEIAPILALFAGTVRGSSGKMPQLNLPKNASGANLQLNLESHDYKNYSIEIVNPDGKLIFKNSQLKVRNSKINFFVPAGKLPVGDYLVKLSALNPNGENESVADYAFRVNRQ